MNKKKANGNGESDGEMAKDEAPKASRRKKSKAATTKAATTKSDTVDRRRYVISISSSARTRRYQRLAKAAKAAGKSVAGLAGEFIERGLTKAGLPAPEAPAK